MKFKLPKLPFKPSALEPHISAETINFHYGKHHKGYVDKLNELIDDTKFEKYSLERIILDSQGDIFNNAGQAWNHAFYWNCLDTPEKSRPQASLLNAIESSFNSVEEFKESFQQLGKELFGSGWVWLVKDKTGQLSLKCTNDAENPMQEGFIPLLVCDVWEHAYYVDYRNEREKYLKSFWKVVNWTYVEKCYGQAFVDGVMSIMSNDGKEKHEGIAAHPHAHESLSASKVTGAKSSKKQSPQDPLLLHH